MPDWAEYKRAERGHAGGDHSRCKWRTCHEAEKVLVALEQKAYDRALWDELIAQNLNPAEYGLDNEPDLIGYDFTHKQRARASIKLLGPGELWEIKE